MHGIDLILFRVIDNCGNSRKVASGKVVGYRKARYLKLGVYCGRFCS